MPWLIDGTFERRNEDFVGSTVWQQDRQAAIKIIDARHDFHDQDLATGIQGTLNLLGYNAMLSDLNVGGFNITNVADGVALADGVNVDQLDAVEAKADQNAIDIAAINTSDPASIITAATFDALDITLDRANGDFVVPMRRFNDFKAGQQIRLLGIDLVAATDTDVDTGLAGRFYMPNNLGGAMNLNIIRPDLDDADLGDNYFVEGLVMIENLGAPATITLQADGVNVDPSDVVGAPTANLNTTYTLSYIIQWDNGTYHEAFVWSAP